MYTSFSLISRSKPNSLLHYFYQTLIVKGFKVIVHSAAHFLDVKLSEDLWTNEDYTHLCKHASMLVRLVNDLQSYQREKQENCVGQLIAQGNGTISEEEAVSELTKVAEQKKVELLQMIFGIKESIIPKEYKELFWRTCKYCCYLYSDEDGFTMSNKAKRDMNALLHQLIPHSAY